MAEVECLSQSVGVIPKPRAFTGGARNLACSATVQEITARKNSSVELINLKSSPLAIIVRTLLSSRGAHFAPKICAIGTRSTPPHLVSYSPPLPDLQATAPTPVP
jgi:hypothetical protein